MVLLARPFGLLAGAAAATLASLGSSTTLTTMVAVATMFAAATNATAAAAASSLGHAVTVEAKREKERKAFRPSLLPPAFTTPRTG